MVISYLLGTGRGDRAGWVLRWLAARLITTRAGRRRTHRMTSAAGRRAALAGGLAAPDDGTAQDPVVAVTVYPR